MTRFLAAIAALLLAASAAPGAAYAADPAVAAPIAQLDAALIAAMKSGSQPFAQRYAQLAPTVQAAFDLDAILQTSVGLRWASFTPEQQQAIRQEFVRFTVASYASNFSSYGGENIVVLPDQRATSGGQVVATQIVPTSGTPTRIDYVMKQEPAGWRAVDVLLDGTISRVAVQRSDFRSLVAGGADALLASLRKKVADLSGGAPLP